MKALKNKITEVKYLRRCKYLKITSKTSSGKIRTETGKYTGHSIKGKFTLKANIRYTIIKSDDSYIPDNKRRSVLFPSRRSVLFPSRTGIKIWVIDENELTAEMI